MKDSYWFKHDSSAGRDIKLRKIQYIYGHEGKGIYWDVIEVLREEETYKLPSDESSMQMLCDLIGYKDIGRFMNWFHDCVRIELFINDGKYFFSNSLLNRMKVWESKKYNGLKAKSKRNRSDSIAKSKRIGSIIEDKIIEYKDKRIQEAWFSWIKYKKTQFNFKYKSIESEQKGINELISLCKGNYDLAQRIVDQSIAKTWKGLFELNNKPATGRINYIP